MKILGIETSCDETAAAVLEIKNRQWEIRSNVVSSQVKIHAKYGGIVPEVAAREHVTAMIPIINKALRRAKIVDPFKEIDLIAVTKGPGLVSSLLVGVGTARTLSYFWDKPLIGVNHLAGHIYSSLLDTKSSIFRFQFPVISLVASGGHTELVLLKDYEKFKVVGQTLDDAVGEAFDKVAKILGLGYPGGPLVSKLAKQGNSRAFDFPRPMIGSGDFNFSFSGLKTAVLYNRDKRQETRDKKYVADVCASFEQAAVDVLFFKTLKAAEKYKVKTVLLGGGVAANKKLRRELKGALRKKLPFAACYLPPVSYTGDNAAMIALAGYFRYKYAKNKSPFKENWRKLKVDPNWEL